MKQQLVIAVALLGLAACAPPPAPPAPFRTAPTGPGIETSSGGRLLELVDADGAVTARVRFANLAARFYEPDAVRSGRLRPAEQGWELVDRQGGSVCRGRVTDAGFELGCEETAYEGHLEDETVTLYTEGRALGVVALTDTGATAEPMGGRVVRCSVDGPIEGSEVAASARTRLSPVASCALAVRWADPRLAESDLVQGALAWFLWRALTSPAPEGSGEPPPEGSATAASDRMSAPGSVAGD